MKGKKLFRKNSEITPILLSRNVIITPILLWLTAIITPHPTRKNLLVRNVPETVLENQDTCWN